MRHIKIGFEVLHLRSALPEHKDIESDLY